MLVASSEAGWFCPNCLLHSSFVLVPIAGVIHARIVAERTEPKLFLDEHGYKKQLNHGSQMERPCWEVYAFHEK
eukprot:2471846-Amphidinium_carterae.1